MANLPLIDRKINITEETFFKYAFSTFTDGSGSEVEVFEDNEFTRIGWRQMERVTAFLVSGKAAQKKLYFDVMIDGKEMDIGLSLKSKTLSDREFDKLKDGGRVYMELANSPAIIWNEMKGEQLSEEDFHQRKQADKFGETLVKTFSKWQDEASKSNKDLNKRPINLKDSVFWCVSMKKPSKGATRSYKIHTFSLKMPKIKKWLFRSDRCLSGFDPKNENEVLFDWYGLSGGQAKYYPSSDTSLYSTNQINTIQLKEVNIIELIKRHWPEFKLG